MKIGTQLRAPTGYASLSQQQTYYLLASRSDPARVFIVYFWNRPHKMPGGGTRTLWGAEIITIPRENFEGAVRESRIVEAECQSLNPPWLSDLSEGDLKANLESHPVDASRVAALVTKIKCAAKGFEIILKSRNPQRVLTEYANSCNMNSARYRLAFCTYMLFGQRGEVLQSQKYRCGKYDRGALPEGTRKLGRTNRRHGKDYGSNLSEDEKERIERYVRANMKLGIKLTDLYRNCMREEFGCKWRGSKGSKGWKLLHHPDGKAFPTKRQFDYVVQKRIGTKAIQIARFGVERVRNRLSGSLGSFTEHVSNLCQCVEGDGYTTTRHPTGIHGTVLPKITVVRIIDSLSRMRLGIGFSLNGERASAYNMALACMAMDKVEFCALFGLTIAPAEWPGEGWPSRDIFDRGPGAIIELEEIAFGELTQAYAGQAKGIVESSQRREDDTSGPPSHLVTTRSPVELAVEEIQKLIVENNTVPVKLPPRLAAAGVKPTPIGLWTALEVSRNDAVGVPIATALKLLPEIKVKCTKDGIECYGEIFRSEELQRSGLLGQAKREGELTLEARIMPMCMRQFWVISNGRPIRVQWSLPFADGEAQTRLTLDELSALHKMNLEEEAYRKEHADAYAVEMADRFEEAFGKEAGQKNRRSGPAKVRTAEARKQTKDIKKVAEGI